VTGSEAYDRESDIGYHAYQAYGEHVEWTAHTGKPMPQWEDLPARIKNAWRLAAEAALHHGVRSYRRRRDEEAMGP
jgi:hypothetical protein